MKSFIVLSLFFFVSSCSGVSMITPDRKVADNVDTSKLYRQEFLQKINAAKEKVRQGKNELALKDLAAIKETTLSTPEIATKKNLIGVINFSSKNLILPLRVLKKRFSQQKKIQH